MIKNQLKEIRMREYIMAQGEFARYLNISIETYNGCEKDVNIHSHSSSSYRVFAP